MKRVFDVDLTPVLARASDEELLPIRDYVLKAATNELDIDDAYKRAPQRPSRYVGELVSEIRKFGGNTVINIFRDAGVDYAEIVRDVAGKLDVDKQEGETTGKLEFRLLMKVLDDSKEKMSSSELAQLQAIINEEAGGHVDVSGKGALAALAAQGAIGVGGFAAYQLGVIVANGVARAVLGRGLTLAANAALTRSIAVFAGPVGLAVSGLWLALDLAGPAYRVTIPCVLQVGAIRLRQSAQA